MEPLSIIVLAGKLSIQKYSHTDDIPSSAYKSEFYSITKTIDEISIVTEQTNTDSESASSSIGWRILKIAGQLDFSLVGIIAAITDILSNAEIPVFVISTFNTDYILIKEENLANAIGVLNADGYSILTDVNHGVIRS